MENRTQRTPCTAFQQDCCMRHFREDVNRYDIKILSKDDVQFQSFRKALDSRMKAGIGTKKYFSRSSNRMKNSYGHQELLAFIHRKH